MESIMEVKNVPVKTTLYNFRRAVKTLLKNLIAHYPIPSRMLQQSKVWRHLLSGKGERPVKTTLFQTSSENSLRKLDCPLSQARSYSGQRFGGTCSRGRGSVPVKTTLFQTSSEDSPQKHDCLLSQTRSCSGQRFGGIYSRGSWRSRILVQDALGHWRWEGKGATKGVMYSRER